MRRRAFIAGLGGAAAWPVLARGHKRFAFANSGCDLLSVNAVPHEVVEGDGQLSVVLAAVVPEFDF